MNIKIRWEYMYRAWYKIEEMDHNIIMYYHHHLLYIDQYLYLHNYLSMAT